MKLGFNIWCKGRDGTEDRVLRKASRKRLDHYSVSVNTPVAQSKLTPHEFVGGRGLAGR